MYCPRACAVDHAALVRSGRSLMPVATGATNDYRVRGHLSLSLTIRRRKIGGHPVRLCRRRGRADYTWRCLSNLTATRKSTTFR